MITRGELWVPQQRPGSVTIKAADVYPITHLASHPQVGYEEACVAIDTTLEVMGFDLEGVLAQFGETEISEQVIAWLNNEATTWNIGVFIITNCRDYNKILLWREQLKPFDIPVYAPFEIVDPMLFKDYVSDEDLLQVEYVKTLRKPYPENYLEALKGFDANPNKAAFVGDKLSDARGAKAAGFVMSVLAPRIGKADHFGDRKWTRRKQLKFMNERNLAFPASNY